MEATHTATPEGHPVTFAVDYPDRPLNRLTTFFRVLTVIPIAKRDLNRWLPLVKWLLVIPHLILLCFLYIGVFFAVIGAWFAILFTGRYPRGIFDFVEGVVRWQNRVVGYALIMVTDRYPPFRLAP